MIEILSGGLQTTIQDLGRSGYMHLGVGPSGAMDALSAITANRMIGVDDNNPVLECTLVGPEIKFHQSMTIAISGSNMVFTINEQEQPVNKVITVDTGAILKFNSNSAGARAYIAFDRTMAITPELNSVATQINAQLGGYHGRALQTGDTLIFTKTDVRNHAVKLASLPNFSGRYQIRYTIGPETKEFSHSQKAQFQQQKYKVTNEFNRMGIRLKGSPVNFDDYPTMTSRGLIPGAIQIPPNGNPIISAQDAQTTGGYLRIGQVIRSDLPVIGQLKANDEVQFIEISLEDALAINKKQASIFTK